MIDSNKLLTNRSSGTTVLSRKSVTNIGIIREDVIKVDKLLKDRLVLSKVREGIERQNQERLRRIGREETLEKDDDRDDNIDLKKKDPKPKKGGGLIAFLIGGVVSTIGFFALRFLPSILKIFGFLKKIAKPLTLVVGGAFLALRQFISVFNDKKNQLQGIDKDEIKVSRIERTIGDFNGALDALVTSLIIGGAISMGLKALKGRNAKDAVKNLKKEAAPRKMRKRRSDAKSYAEVKRDIDLREYDSLTPEAKARIRRENISRTLREAEEVIPNRKPRVQREDFLGMNKPRRRVQVPDSPIDLLQRQKQRSTRRIVTSVGDQLLNDILNSKSFKKKASKLKELKKAGVEIYTETNQNVFSRVVDGNETFYLRGKGGELTELTEVTIDNKRRLITKKFGTQEQKTQQPQGKINRNNFKSAGAMGRQSYPPGFQYEMIRPSIFEQGRSALSQAGDFLSPSNLKGLLKTRGGIVRILSNIGGDAFVETFKQGLKGSIGVIPILGDVFGFLLDYFVFGEPIGRAAFKAVGSFALSSLIGAVGLALGGPVGAFLGGVIGGIGGDILGGISYDLFFGTEGGVSAKSSATKGVVKGAVTQTFEDGGYVNPDLPRSNFKPLVNSIDKSTEIRSTPFYNKITAGRVSFVPFPLVIPSKEQSQQEEQLIAMGNKASETRTFSNLYKR